MLMLMFVETFKTDIILLWYCHMCSWPIISELVSLILTISLGEIKGNVNKCIGGFQRKKLRNGKWNTFFFYFIGNGGGSGGRISIYLSEYMLFNGNLIATGGNGSYPGLP
jgi:hypothetical protein